MSVRRRIFRASNIVSSTSHHGRKKATGLHTYHSLFQIAAGDVHSTVYLRVLANGGKPDDDMFLPSEYTVKRMLRTSPHPSRSILASFSGGSVCVKHIAGVLPIG